MRAASPLYPRLWHESALLNAEARDPLAPLSVLMAAFVSLARLCTCGASIATAPVTVSTEASPWI